jgi:hypothetical protein
MLDGKLKSEKCKMETTVISIFQYLINRSIKGIPPWINPPLSRTRWTSIDLICLVLANQVFK